jgi:flagella synthesis protein FlgN
MQQRSSGSPTDGQASPGAGLAQEIGLAQELVEALRLESARLVEADAEGLMSLLLEKTRIVGRMSEQALARHRALTAAGYSGDEEGMAAWTRKLAPASPSVQAWNRLLELAREGKRINNTNGLLINKQIGRNQAALEILHTAKPNNNTYGPDGQTAGQNATYIRAVG